MIAWLVRRWPWAGAALLGLVIAVRVWWARWKDRRELERARDRAEDLAAERDRATAERDQARGQANVADARARVATAAADAAAAGDRAAGRIDDVPLSGDPAADRARLYDAVRVLPAPGAAANDHDP